MNDRMLHAILTVDPDEYFLLQIRMLKLGILSSLCSSEPMAIHHLPYSDFLIVNVDSVPPDFIQNIRTVSKTILIVAISSDIDPFVKDDALMKRADYFLLKPYSLNDLKAILHPKKTP